MITLTWQDRCGAAVLCCVSLWLLAGGLASGAGRPPTAPLISKAAYSVSAGERLATVSATLNVQTSDEGWQNVPLMPTSVVLRNLAVSGGKGYVDRSGPDYVAKLEGRGSFTVKLEFLVDVRRDGEAYTATLPLVRSGASTVDFACDKPDYSVQVTPDIPVERQPQEDGTAVRIYPAGADELKLRWLPAELERAPEATFDATEISTLTLRPDSYDRHIAMRVDVRRGEVKTLTAALPPETDVTSVAATPLTGPGRPLLQDWQVVEKDKRPNLRLQFASPASGGLLLRITSERVQEDTGKPFTIVPFELTDAARQTGQIRAAAPSSFQVTEVSSAGIRRGEVEADLPAWAPKDFLSPGDGGVAMAYRYHRLPARVLLRVTELQPRVTARTASYVYLQAGVVELTATVEYTIENAPVERLRIGLADGLIPLSVTGDNVQGWETKDGVVHVKLQAPALGSHKVDIRCVQKLRKVDGVLIPDLKCIDADRQSGSVGVSAGAGVTVVHHHADRFVQVNVEQLPKWLRQRDPKLAYVYERPGGKLAVSTKALKPRLSVTGYGTATVFERSVHEHYTFQCRVERQPIFGLTFNLPAGLSPVNVAGDGVEDWDFDSQERTINVSLSKGVTDRKTYRLFLEMRLPSGVDRVNLGGVTVAGADEQAGWFGAGTQGNLELSPTDARGTNPIPVGQVPRLVSAHGDVSFAYRWSGEDWGVESDVRRLRPRIEAQTRTALIFEAGRVRVQSDISFQISRAKVDEFVVLLPQGAGGSEVTGSDVQARELTDRGWRLRLSEPVMGRYRCRAVFTLPVSRQSDRFEYTGLTLPQARRQEGTIAVYAADPRYEIAAERLRNASRTRESTDMNVGDHSFLGAFTYSEADHGIVFRVKGLGLAERLRLKASNLHLDTVVKGRGHAVSYLTCRIADADTQFLSLRLPEKSTLWGTYISGQPVKPSRRESGEILIPLLEAPADSAFDLQLIWAESEKQMGLASALELEAPELELPAQSVNWNVYLPANYQVLSTAGNMEMLQREPWYEQGLPAVTWGYLEAAWPVLRVFLFLFGVVAAILLAAWIARKINETLSGGLTVRRVLPWIAVASLIVIVVAMMMPALHRSREAARRTSAMNDLKEIGTALAMYRSDHDGKLPPSLRQLFPDYLRSEDVLVSPVTKKQYVYDRDADIEKNAAGTPVAWDHPTEDGQNVLFGDWHAEFVAKPGWDKLHTDAMEVAEDQSLGIQQAGKEMAQTEPATGPKAPLRETEDEEVRAPTPALKKDKEAGFERAMQLADSYMKRGNYGAAREQYRRAKRMRPRSSAPENRLERLSKMEQAAGRAPQQAEEEPKARKAERQRVTRSYSAGALVSLSQSLGEKADSGWESSVAQDRRQEQLLALVRGRQKRADLNSDTTVRIEQDELQIEGPPGRVQDIVEAARDLRQQMLEKSREITRAKQKREEEIAARRRAEMRRKMAALRLESGGQAGTLTGSRTAGALPLQISFPSVGTRAFPFHMDYAGTSTATIQMTCMQTGLAMVLQGAIAALVFAAVGVLSWRNAGVGLAVATGVGVVLLFMVQMSGEAAAQYFVMALIGLCLAAPFVLGRLLVTLRTRANT